MSSASIVVNFSKIVLQSSYIFLQKMLHFFHRNTLTVYRRWEQYVFSYLVIHLLNCVDIHNGATTLQKEECSMSTLKGSQILLFFSS